MTRGVRFISVVVGAVALACVQAPSPARAHSTEALPSAPLPAIASKSSISIAPKASAKAARQEPTVLASKSRSPSKGSALAAARDHAHPPFESGRVSFSLHFDGVETSLGTMSAFVLPGRTLEVAATGAGKFEATAGGGMLAANGASSWSWTAPAAHGNHEIRIRNVRGTTTEEARLHVFVLHPYDGSERIGKYRVGRYQKQAKDGNPAYSRPEGLVEVTEKNLDLMISPHFRLGQFLCKGDVGFPRYVLLRTPLLLKLEMLMEALAGRGLPARTLHVMSGYRTPAYNAGIGNETIWSRHTYGDAADVFLDRDEDGQQDDLNGDGKSTSEDARILFELVESALDDSVPGQMAGGLAVYGPNSAHGPFLHIDTRGHRARW